MTMLHRTIGRRWMTATLGAGTLAAMLAACGGTKSAPDAAPPPADVAADNIVVVDTALVESGPSLSGTLTPDRAAQLRAQAAGAILALYVDEGAPVNAGQPVALIDTLSLAEVARSARSQLVSAQLSADVARRNYERFTSLHNAGAIADRDLEVAHNQSVAAEAVMADARSKLTTADKQMANATVRAPFAGVVSTRPVSVGDVLQVGNPIMTVVDPTELQLEASVAAEFIGQIKIGTKVDFSVNGNSAHVFSGRVARINPTVDSVTRQVRLYITVPNHDRTLAGGLFAQGRVAMSAVRALAIPTGALDSKLASPSVRRLRGGKIESVPVTIGLRDDLADRVQVAGGLSLGDTLLVGAALATPVGASVRVTHTDH
jgi:membrane fusion protein, multidrug efflux system